MLDTFESDLGVRIVWGADVDGVDVVAFHQLPPIRFIRSEPPFLGEGFHLLFIATADGLSHRDVVGVKEVAELRVGVGVGPAHEAVPDEANADFLFH